MLDQMMWSPNAGIGNLLPGGQMVRINGLIPPEASEVSKVTVLGACLLSSGSVADLSLDETSRILPPVPLSSSHVPNLVEPRPGAGLFKRLGVRHRCAVELHASPSC